MSRRTRKNSGLNQLIVAPWQTSAVIAFMLLTIIHYGFPFWAGDNPIRHAITAAIRPFALFGVALLALIALINFIRAHITSSSPKNPFTSPSEQIRSAQIRNTPSFEYNADDNVLNMPEVSSEQFHSKPDAWSLDLLRQVEWKRFEELCAAYFCEMGLRAETIRCGADGGVDVKLFRGDAPDPDSILQCKAWNSRYVGVKPVRELFGVMAHQKVRRGIFLTTSIYTKEALAFAKDNPIFLIDGEKFFSMISKLSSEAQKRLLDIATEGEYLVPSCPSCGIKMVERKGPKINFWGCQNYPKCRLTFVMRDMSAASLES
jgi:restriction system protein